MPGIFNLISGFESQIMLYGKYNFVCRLEKGAALPRYKGSTFRGVFGIALKRVVCALKRQECTECLLKNRCLYVRVFETPLALKAPEGSKISTPPHPFVIEPPQTEKMEFEAGHGIACDLILFGEANTALPYFVYAFEQMGRIGIGKRMNGKRGRFTLEAVKTGRKTLYAKTDRKLDLASPVEELNLPDPEESEDNRFSLRVRLETPLRLKFKNEIRADLPFHILVRAMLSRTSSLLNTWGDGEPDLDYKGLIERAGDVRITANTLKWFDWKRYSNRQERKMFMGGLLGSVTYEGNLNEYLPLLDFCAKVHIGKNTSFGLGKIETKKVR
jgi:hypothetical protein